ncbi:FYVE, RhoGEF and PH domain-containing protein 6-like isoform X2 [Hoplias malabaricus]|uniref:FYVE, RhoGEF and PH domain-containing protein 6-like isoform X2 n=1 Tax=Hoplias malabaricus TaxID=27720 RepID=UPI003462A07E
MERPPVAPKPKVIPPPKPILLQVSKPALNPEFSQPLKSALKPAVAPKPPLRSAPPLEHTPLASNGKCDECCPKENSRRPIHYGKCVETCLNSQPEGPKTPKPRARTKAQHVTDLTPPLKVSVQGPSSDQPKQTRVFHTQSLGGIQHVHNHTVANGVAGYERHVNEKQLYSSDDGAKVHPATVIGSPPKASDKDLKNNIHHNHASGKQNGSLTHDVVHVRKPPPLPVHSKQKVINTKQLDKTDLISEDSEGPAKGKFNVLEHSTTALSEKERLIMTYLHPPANGNKSTRGDAETQHDKSVYPRWRSPQLERRQNQPMQLPSLDADKQQSMKLERCSNENQHSDLEEKQMNVQKNQHPTSKNLPKQPIPKTTTAKEPLQKPHRNKENMTEGSIFQSDPRHVGNGPHVTAVGKSEGKGNQKMISNSGHLECNNSTPTKKFGSNLRPKSKSFSPADMLHKKTSRQKIVDLDVPVKKSKRKQAPDLTTAKDVSSVEEYVYQLELPEYKSHLLTVHSKETAPKTHVAPRPSSPKEQSVDGEVFNLYENIPSPRTQTQQPYKTQQTYFSNNEENLYEVPDVPGGCTDGNRRNAYEEMLTSDDSEEEIDGSSEVEEDGSSYSDKGQSQDDIKRTKLAHIANEIMSSEKVFVDVLKLLHITFRDTVNKASIQAGKPVIEERNLNQILYSLPQLYELNCNLLSELENRVANWNEHSAIADIFLTKGPYLKMYSSYICEFDKNVALLEEQCKKNLAFAKVVREFESSPCCANLAVKHYMLKPVQRLPQYQLLLTDYLKNLNENSPDYKDTQAALMLVKDVATHANETMRQGDNFQKVMQVQCSLSGHHEIVQPGRVLLKEGTLMKLSRKVMQPRMFFLFNDTLLYTTPLQSGQYKLNNQLSLAGMKVSKPSQEGYQNELNIESVERSFILSAGSPGIRDAWLEAISNAIDSYTKKMTSFSSNKIHEEGDKEGLDAGAQLGSKAPIWIPDLRATMCMICTCEFTLTRRRHHCRACGKVVCQDCSTNKYPLEYLKNQPARVCDQCFEVLHNNSSGAGVVSPNSKTSGGFHLRKQKKIPAALKEVSANTDDSSMSSYLERMKPNKKQWKRLWFVIKSKVLYTYAASEDIVALESLPLLGFSVTEDESESSQQFKLYHKEKLFYIFRTDDSHIYHRWIEALHEAFVL